MRAHASGQFGRGLAVLALAILVGPVRAQEHHQLEAPGFRPESPLAPSFLSSLETPRVAVLPTMVRSVDRTTYSVASQTLIVELLREGDWATAAPRERTFDFGFAKHQSQWEMFQGSMGMLAEALDERPAGGDYTIVMEIVLPPGNREVFGIHTFILDPAGRNAFSFLLNSHHAAFAEAELTAADGSEAALEAMVLRASEVGVMALKAQVESARACAAWMEANPPHSMAAGVFQGFDGELPALQTASGDPLGFTTFSDGESTVRLGSSRDHPPRDGESAGNATLRVDLDVSGWAGFVYLPYDESERTWHPQDWSAFEGFSFWIYGLNSGTQLFVDVLDNRNPCSQVEDAERYTFEFADDFSGWKQIVVPFVTMVRKEIGNDAPNDGLGLERVHGWAFGALATGGPRTWYLDSFSLLNAGAT